MEQNVLDRELTVKEVSAFCGVHINSVWTWLKNGKLKGYRIETAEGRNANGKGVEWRVKSSDLVEFIMDRNVNKKENR